MCVSIPAVATVHCALSVVTHQIQRVGKVISPTLAKHAADVAAMACSAPSGRRVSYSGRTSWAIVVPDGLSQCTCNCHRISVLGGGDVCPLSRDQHDPPRSCHSAHPASACVHYRRDDQLPASPASAYTEPKPSHRHRRPSRRPGWPG